MGTHIFTVNIYRLPYSVFFHTFLDFTGKKAITSHILLQDR
jgi:hypothetical protein